MFKLLPVFAALGTFQAAPSPAPPQEPPITSVVMEQFECFWRTCPHYVIAISRDGSAKYTGLAVTKTLGEVQLKLSASSFTKIVSELNKVNYFSLHDSYSTEADGCKEITTDQSSVSFLVTRGGETKKVYLYYGCNADGVTDSLSDLASLIDREAGLAPFLGRQK